MGNKFTRKLKLGGSQEPQPSETKTEKGQGHSENEKTEGKGQEITGVDTSVEDASEKVTHSPSEVKSGESSSIEKRDTENESAPEPINKEEILEASKPEVVLQEDESKIQNDDQV